MVVKNDDGCPPPRRKGGLVSQRVQMIEGPFQTNSSNNNDGKKGYFHRSQDSFHTSTSDVGALEKEEQAEESRDETSSAAPVEEEEIISSPPVPTPPAVTPKVKAVKNFSGATLIQSGINSYADGDYEKAFHAFKSALKMQRASTNEDDITVALTLSNLGAVYLQLDQIDEAERVLYESLEMKKRIAPNLILTDTLNNLGNCANLRGDYSTSLIFYEDALEDIRAKKGRRADEVNALFNIGRLHIQQRKWKNAMDALNETCYLARQLYGTNHYFVAQTLDLMGFVQLTTSKLESAMVSFTGALAIYRRLHGPMHLEVANSLFNVGLVREAKGDVSDAWEAYTTSRDLYHRLGTAPDFPGYESVRRSVASVEVLIAKNKKQEEENVEGTTPDVAANNDGGEN